jgi:hypothetical protein
LLLNSRLSAISGALRQTPIPSVCSPTSARASMVYQFRPKTRGIFSVSVLNIIGEDFFFKPIDQVCELVEGGEGCVFVLLIIHVVCLPK